ncbi:MAG TPA: GNAT family N-acetyltransferase [Actinomycetota bacterium]|nr:GNAT family N-acetyltransferase [Actinomycetota bacterium]
MDIELRTMSPDEGRKFLEVTEAAFGAGLTDDVWNDLKHVLETDRSIGAFDGARMVGSASAFTLRFTVPGGEVDGAGVTMVGVLPSHRRRGVLRTMMESQLREIKERGEPIAALWASEDAIYGRFGYGAASLQALVDIPRHRASFLDDSPIRGALRMVEGDEAAELFPVVYEAVRKQRPGTFVRSEKWWRHRILRAAGRDESGPFFKALLEHDGVPSAYAVYQVHQKWEQGFSRGAVELREVMAATPQGHLDIWKFLFGIDLVESVHSTGFFLPSDHPLQLMLAEPRYLRFLLSNGLWVRIVDVAAALEARGYARDGAVTLEVVDPLLQANAGTWAVVVDNRRATVGKVDGPADVRLGIGELGSLYLGQFTFSQLAAAGRLDVGDAAALARADDMWRTAVAPWCPEIF